VVNNCREKDNVVESASWIVLDSSFGICVITNLSSQSSHIQEMWVLLYLIGGWNGQAKGMDGNMHWTEFNI
jgi:hypothetical protein